MIFRFFLRFFSVYGYEEKDVPFVHKEVESRSVREGAGDEAKRENLGKFHFWRPDFRGLT
jgi:hypothetical protein